MRRAFPQTASGALEVAIRVPSRADRMREELGSAFHFGLCQSKSSLLHTNEIFFEFHLSCAGARLLRHLTCACVARALASSGYFPRQLASLPIGRRCVNRPSSAFTSI